jgi:hypothetical protein
MNGLTRFALISLLACGSVQAGDFDHTHADFAVVLKEHVRDGLVDYQALRAHPETLNQYLESLAAVSERTFNGWVIPQRLAYLINLYNATVLKMVVEHYPVRSFQRVAGWFGDPFEEPVVRLFGARITLTILRDNIMRRHYAEPGIHFALVPAARGAPPLRSEPYQPDRLYDQFADQVRAFLADGHNNEVNLARERLELSPLFKRFQEDFVQRAGSVRVYLQPYLPAGHRAEDFSIRYRSYDDALNDLHPARR